MKQTNFEESRLPYETLAKFGLTAEMIEDLPNWAREDIAHGGRSPVLPIKVTEENGMTHKSHTRFSFVKTDSGRIDVVFYPVLDKSPLEDYTKEQQTELLASKAVIADWTDGDGRKSKAFVQIDTETNQVMSVPTPVIGRNLQVLKDENGLSAAELMVMQKGEPLTLIVNNEQITLGIDLNSKTGIRIGKGDGEAWKENAKREWDKYTFGGYGCWVMGDDGNLDYVYEEDYTEELWNEQKKSGERNRARMSF